MTHFSTGSPGNTTGAYLYNNLYFNGGRPIPRDPGRVLNVADDPKAIVADPKLPADLKSIVPPTWRADEGRFADGSRTIAEVRRRLVESYGTPGEGSPALDAADPRRMPETDILGRPRGPKPDLGAVEARP